MPSALPVGVFDSGVGGLSVLGMLRRVLPQEHFIYYGDTKNAPYGTKSREEVLDCVGRVMDELLRRDVKAVVIACNTATSVAAQHLRDTLSLPIIGMEPALKPAQEGRKDGKILVLATPVTLSLPKFQLLMDRYGEGAERVACPGLMDLIEQENFSGASEYIENRLKEYDLSQVDALVLGCTHYVFMKHSLKEMLPAHIAVYDGNLGTARQLERVLRDNDLLAPEGTRGGYELKTSGNEKTVIPVMERLLARAMVL